MKRSILVLIALATVSVRVSADPTSDLFKAASDGDLAAVRHALDNGAGVNSLDENGRSAVLIATIGSHSGVLKHLLDKGANPNVRLHTTYRELFPLPDADKRGTEKTSVVKLLLKAGASQAVAAKFPLIVEKPRTGESSTAVASRQMTPLMIASIKGDVACVSLLIAAGADVNARSFEGHTSLMFAVLSYPFHPGADRLGATVADLVAPDSAMANVLSASASPTRRAR